MVDLPKRRVISRRDGRKWWEQPDALWQRLGPLRRHRLRRVVRAHILPLLQELEELHLRDHGDASPLLTGRSLGEIERDDLAIEATLHILDLALSAGLVALGEPGNGADRPPPPDGTVPVGATGMTLQEARMHYLAIAARLIVKGSDQDPKKAREYLDGLDLVEAGQLHKLRLLMGLEPLSVMELHAGLKGRLRLMMEKDDDYLDAFGGGSGGSFLRPLRFALRDDFPAILKWSPDFIRAIAEGLDHSAKIVALGSSILEVEDPEVIRALGKWPMKEIDPKSDEWKGKAAKDRRNKKRKRYITRIAQVKKALGPEFRMLLTSSPTLIEQAGGWSNQQIGKIRHYLQYLNGEVLDTMAPLEFDHQVGLMEGLWETLGRSFMENDLTSDAGVTAVRGIITEIEDMASRGTAPSDVKAVIEGGLFNKHMSPFLAHA
ncbi:MAG: hypothetical protein QF654_01555 [Alphaproteobacteria bacterium]|jgi:hypothetical protein|nr:hypothetical protein [Alphaproteobacteria bacterium]